MSVAAHLGIRLGEYDHRIRIRADVVWRRAGFAVVAARKAARRA